MINYNYLLGWIKIDKIGKVPFVLIGPIEVKPLKSPLGAVFGIKFNYKPKSILKDNNS